MLICLSIYRRAKKGLNLKLNMEGGNVVQTPLNDESSIELAVFDSFSKSVMRNTGRNIASDVPLIYLNNFQSTYMSTEDANTYQFHR